MDLSEMGLLAEGRPGSLSLDHLPEEDSAIMRGESKGKRGSGMHEPGWCSPDLFDQPNNLSRCHTNLSLCVTCGSVCHSMIVQLRERGKGEGPGEGGGSQGELGEGPGVADLQRCWGFPEQSYTGRI